MEVRIVAARDERDTDRAIFARLQYRCARQADAMQAGVPRPPHASARDVARAARHGAGDRYARQDQRPRDRGAAASYPSPAIVRWMSNWRPGRQHFYPAQQAIVAVPLGDRGCTAITRSTCAGYAACSRGSIDATSMPLPISMLRDVADLKPPALRRVVHDPRRRPQRPRRPTGRTVSSSAPAATATAAIARSPAPRRDSVTARRSRPAPPRRRARESAPAATAGRFSPALRSTMRFGSAVDRGRQRFADAGQPHERLRPHARREAEAAAAARTPITF